MAKAFSVASWNVEHFGGKNNSRPIEPIIEFLAAQNADILAVYEVTGATIFRPLVEAMPGYQFHITEGPQTQEILVGVRHGIAAFVTQKLEFKAGQHTLRPGVLVTPRINNKYYPIVFLHLKSAADPKGFGLRDDMLARARKFRKRLNEEAADGRANYLFVGDLNTMGFNYPYTEHDISGEQEIHELNRRVRYRQMRILTKNAEATWWNGSTSTYPRSNLDHAVAAEHLTFTQFDGADIDVRGWPKETTTAAQDAWIMKYSDHALLYFEVQQ